MLNQYHEVLWWTFLNLISIVILAFYSMQEMACVSFNRIRLHYYVSKRKKAAIWLNELLKHPANLFGTTLIGVNAAMFFGSECARQTYLALGFNPDFAPISQVVIVVIFAELAPMFAARRFAEHVALLGAPILYFSSLIMTPLLWMIKLFSLTADYLLGKKNAAEEVVLNQEDLQKILALQDEDLQDEQETDFHLISQKIFSLRLKNAKKVMKAMQTIPSLPYNAIVNDAYHVFQQPGIEYVPIIHKNYKHVVGIIHPRDLIKVPNTRRVREYADPPWYIPQNTPLTEIIKQFRSNNKNVAVVINEHGHAIGMITLNDMTEEIFGELAKERNEGVPTELKSPLFIIDRTFPGQMKVKEFNEEFEGALNADPELTLSELITAELGHHPTIGESIYIPPFELTVKDTSLLEVKRVIISTRLH